MTIVALLCLIAPAGPPTDRLTGKVLSEEGGGVAGVEVVAESGEVARTVVSGQDGAFTFDELWPGHYRVTASAPYRAPGAAEVSVPAEASVTVVVGALHVPPDRQPHPAGGLLSGLPVESRTPAAALRLGFAARARAGTRARFAGAYGGPEWRLDGFDFTHPITGQPLVAIGLAGVVALSASETSSGAWGAGPAGELASRGGSNRPECGVSASAGTGAAGTLEGDVSGPLVRDQLWYAVSGGGAAWPGPERTRTAEHGLARLTWQMNARNKLSLVAADASGVEASRATFGGLKWESLLADNLVLLATGSGFDDSSRLKMLAGSAHLSWFVDHLLGEHDLEADARLAVVGAVYRPHLNLEDRWRPSRHFTVGVQYTQAAVAHGSGGGLSLTWDATHDGRTAVRARASSTAVPGLLAPVEPPTRVEEAALGYERDVTEGGSLGLELLRRRAAGERETVLALHAQQRRSRFKASAMYLARFAPSFRGELTAAGSVGLGGGISAGAVILHAPRASWLPLFDEARGVPLGPGDGGSGWLLGVQVRADLGWLVGQSTALWLDALNLTGDRTPISSAIRTPPRQLRLNLRIEL